MNPSGHSIDQQVRLLINSLDAARNVDDATLRDRLVQFERIVNMAQGAQAALMCEMSVRDAESESEFIADEIAITLSTTKVAASNRSALASDVDDHPTVAAAWRVGLLDARKVKVICDGLADASPIAIEVLTSSVIEYAESHTGPEVRRWLSRRVIASDPEAAEAQREPSLSNRMVSVTPLGNGLSEFVALLPSVQARQIYDTVNAVAQAADANDVRTMDQRRADGFVDLITGRADAPQIRLNVVMSLDSVTGASDSPAMISGIGPVTAHEARQVLGEPLVRRLLTDAATGHLVDISEKQYRPSAQLDRAVRTRDHVCRFPGCSRPATTKRSGTDLDHSIPWPRGETTASNLAVLCRHHHRLKHSPGWSAELMHDGVMRWTTPTGKTFVTEAWAYADTG